MHDSRNQADMEQTIAEIRDKIQKAREFVSDREGDYEQDESTIAAALEGLNKANERVRALAESPTILPPSPPTIRGRLGRTLIRFLGKLLWWQHLRLTEFASAVAQTNAEEFKHLAKLSRRVSHLETAQLKLQSAQIDVLTERDLTRLEGRIESAVHQADRRIEATIAQIAAGAEAIDRLKLSLAETNAAIASMQSETARLRDSIDKPSEHELRLAALENKTVGTNAVQARLSGLGNFTYQTRAQVSLLDRRLSMLISEVRKHRAGTSRADEASGPVPTDDHRLDAVYVAFEDAFRGSREDIKSKQAVYIPILKESGIGTRNMPILDIGCGRGEWLELLRDHQLTGSGIDRNEIMLEECRNWGLDVAEGEAVSYLSALPAVSLGAITGFHIIEHMPFLSFIALLDECLRVLKPGGMVIFETPNPGNFHVSVQNFYMDPTHLKPLPSAMIHFFVEARGFCDVNILELHPYPESLLLPNDPYGIGQKLNGYLYGPQDYAVIGRKV